MPEEINNNDINLNQPVETADTSQSAKSHFNWKRSLITLVFIILTAGVVGGAMWYVMDSNMKKEREANDKSVKELQVKIDELKKQAEENKNTNDWKTYKNEKYKFQLTFSDKWKGYTVQGSPGEGGMFTDSYIVMFPTSDSSYVSANNNPATVFVLPVYTEEQWNSKTDQEGPKATLISKKDGFVFAYNLASQWPADWQIQKTDVQELVKTFKFY
jgi:hypothetical protein